MADTRRPTVSVILPRPRQSAVKVAVIRPMIIFLKTHCFFFVFTNTYYRVGRHYATIIATATRIHTYATDIVCCTCKVHRT